MHTLRLEVEAALAHAHRHVYRAAAAAEGFPDQGLADDLWQVLRWLEARQTELLRGRKPKQGTPGPCT